MTKNGTPMTEFDHQDELTPCSCCPEPIELGMRPYLDIHAAVPQGDARLVVLLYHNWVAPETSYLVFGTLHRILGLVPRNPFLRWLGLVDESEKPQN